MRGQFGYPQDDPFRVRWIPDRLDDPKHSPAHWKRGRRILVCSMGDLFCEEVREEWREEVFSVMRLVKRHTYLLLTKRAYALKRWYFDHVYNWADSEKFKKRYLHVHFGVTVEDQPWAERIEYLLKIPARVRWVSAEPLLGPLDLSPWLGPRKINWVVCGPETGPGARWMDPAWPRALRDQCVSAGVPFFFKGWGGDRDRRLDYREWNEVPEKFYRWAQEERETPLLSGV